MNGYFYSAPAASSASNSKRMWIDDDVDMEDATLPSPSKTRNHSSTPYGQDLVYERTKIMMMEGQRRMQQESTQQQFLQRSVQQQQHDQQTQLRANAPLYSGKGKAIGPINAFQLMFKSQQAAATAATPAPSPAPPMNTLGQTTLSHWHTQQHISPSTRGQNQYPSGHECPNNCLDTFRQQPGSVAPTKCTFCDRPQCLECSINCRSCDEPFCGACSTPMYAPTIEFSILHR
ncbi:hypothetical protein DFQ27_001432 [Actinomortierella ambigua]|uniref:Apoptosis regulatory protein Siva n=1 Tax=Actinomortierella ambigua TaxID=1343610 RepID=A0A9P6QDU5_9FUNG|nr:hypothetical protein DFQ27_001432 [Actinomortierella ambigua]